MCKLENYKINKTELLENGYSILTNIYSKTEANKILACIECIEKKGSYFSQTKGLFAIRQLINVIPNLKDLIFNQNLTEIVSNLFNSKSFLTKAIYFDKPSESNWFVAYHQDLTISVDKKVDVKNYINWTFKKGQFGVQPPIKILQSTITVRIHLDKTDKNNGALKIIPKSHLKGIYRTQSINWEKEKEHICEVEKGGVMLMKPLTLHASNRTTNQKQRRVIHLEFCNQELAKPLIWLERSELKSKNVSINS